MLKIDRHARDILRHELGNTLSNAGDLQLYCDGFHALDVGFAHIRRRAHIALHMLDDLGWEWRDDPRQTYYLTLPESDLRWWISEVFESVEELLRSASRSLALAGYVHPPEYVETSSLSADELAAHELEEAREETDKLLDLRAVLLDVLARLDREGGA